MGYNPQESLENTINTMVVHVRERGPHPSLSLFHLFVPSTGLGVERWRNHGVSSAKAQGFSQG